VAVNSIVLQYYRLYALLHAIPPPWGSHLSHPPDATTFPGGNKLLREEETCKTDNSALLYTMSAILHIQILLHAAQPEPAEPFLAAHLEPFLAAQPEPCRATRTFPRRAPRTFPRRATRTFPRRAPRTFPRRATRTFPRRATRTFPRRATRTFPRRATQNVPDSSRSG